jgi:colicin import membrane protein
MTDSTPYTIPAESRRWRALILAAALHAMLLVALWLGARGQSDAQVPLKAEQAARTEAAAPVTEMAKPEPRTKRNPNRQVGCGGRTAGKAAGTEQAARTEKAC